MKPQVIGPARRAKYPWDTLRSDGWFFVHFESGHQAQDKSIRAAGRAQGFRRLSIRRASLVPGGPAAGWMVALPSYSNPHPGV